MREQQMKMILIFMSILLSYALINYYLGLRICQGLVYLFPDMPVWPYLALHLFFALSVFLAFFPWPWAAIKKFFTLINGHWMGAFFYLFLLFLLVDLILVVLRVLGLISFPPLDSLRFLLTTGVMVATLLLIIYGTYNASRLHLASYDLVIDRPEIDLVRKGPLRLVLISDLHLGAIHSERNLKQTIKMLNKLDADLVCLVGDIFNDDYALISNPDQVQEQLASIKSKYGVYASLGNHDGGKSLGRFLDLLDKSKVQVLLDENLIIDNRLVLVGRLDPSPIGGFGQMTRGETDQVMANIDSSYPIIVMDHTPSAIDEYGPEVDLILAGHTHGGQIYPFNFATSRAFAVGYGYYRESDTSAQVIVSSGASTWGMPLRVGTKNELVLINLDIKVN